MAMDGPGTAHETIVEIGKGRLRGRVADGVHVFRGVPYAALPFHRSLACPGRLPVNVKVRLVGAAAAAHQPEHVAEEGTMRCLIPVTLILSAVSCSQLRRQRLSPAPVRGHWADRRPN
jgi:hypothetical protein